MLKRFGNPAAFALPAGVLTLIVLMVVPIPSFMLDVFFVLNIALSVAILMAAMNAEKPLDFSSFPSVLLFATLLRLALNVASTRIVLVNGHEGGAAAGHVIEAFGEFLIGGNFAIDADLAAGLMTGDEAKARRREVATEADFYGSMDGSSKFVKGDAIAALLILGVNIIAGFCLGMISHGLTAAQSAQFYITLAVGDALVAQVPSLLLSIAAAVIVTRVSDSRNLTGQISGQFANPAIWLPVTIVMTAVAVIPAMPQTVFMPAAALSGWLWWTLKKRAARPAPVMIEAVEAVDPGRILLDEVSDQTLVTVEMGYGLIHLVDERRGSPLVARITGVRKQLSQQFGFIVPQFRVRDSLELGPNNYRILLGGVPIGIAEMRPDKVLAIDAGEASADHGLRGEKARDPSFGCPAIWIDPAQRDLAIAEGFLTVDASTVIATHINQVLGDRPSALLGPDEVRAILDGVKERSAGLVETIHPQPMSLGALTRLFHALLDDGISIAHPLPILSALSQALQQTTDHDRLIDLLRTALGEMIVGRICMADERLPVVTLEAGLEQMIVAGMHDPATGQPVIEPDLARGIGERITAIVAERGPSAPPIALIVQPRARRPLASLLRLRAPQCLVLSISELPPSQPIEVISVIGGEAPQVHPVPTLEGIAA